MASRIPSRSTLFAAALLLAGCDPRSQTDAPPRPVEGAPSRVDDRSVAAAEAEAEDTSTAVQASAGSDEAASDEAADVTAEGVYEEAGPPKDYGLIKPSDPPPDPSTLTLHALAGYEVVAIYDKPDMEATKLGYLRLGQRLKVTTAVEGKGCPKSWHQLPTGGYACVGRGLVVDADRPPYMHRTPPPPDKSAALPYAYAFVRKWNSPMYYRIPDRQEQAEANRQREVLEAERNGEPPPGAQPKPGPEGGASDKPAASPSTPQDGVAPAEGSKAAKKSEAADALPSVTDDPDAPAKEAEVADAPAQAKPAEADNAEPATDEPEPEPIRLPLSPSKPWLERGYYLSLAEKESDHGRSWWRTARNGYVEASAVAQITPKDFQGQVLDEGASFPFGWVMAKNGAKLFELDDEGKLKGAGSLERRTFVDLSEETEIGGKTYMLTVEGKLIRKDALRLADPQPLPEGLQPWERWIDVDLDKQMLVAYEGTQPVFTTLVSSGRKGTPEESYETPTGRWRIYSKHISSTMAGTTASDGTYSIQDVPWTMFFEGDFALHGAFWHEGFGRVRSHGCVNLGPTDARWLFHWTTPFLPEGWHGVHAHKDSPGTTVVVRKGDQS